MIRFKEYINESTNDIEKVLTKSYKNLRFVGKSGKTYMFDILLPKISDDETPSLEIKVNNSNIFIQVDDENFQNLNLDKKVGNLLKLKQINFTYNNEIFEIKNFETIQIQAFLKDFGNSKLNEATTSEDVQLLDNKYLVTGVIKNPLKVKELLKSFDFYVNAIDDGREFKQVSSKNEKIVKELNSLGILSFKLKDGDIMAKNITDTSKKYY